MVGGGEGELLAIDGPVVVFDERLIFVFGVWYNAVERIGQRRVVTRESHGVFVPSVALLPYKPLLRYFHMVGIVDRSVNLGRRQRDVCYAICRDGSDRRGECFPTTV